MKLFFATFILLAFTVTAYSQTAQQQPATRTVNTDRMKPETTNGKKATATQSVTRTVSAADRLTPVPVPANYVAGSKAKEVRRSTTTDAMKPATTK